MSAGANYQREGGGLLCSFLKIENSDPACCGKCPDSRDLWVNFSLKMFQEYLDEKTQIFSHKAFCLFVVARMFLKVTLFLETFSVLKNSWVHAWSTTVVG